MLIGVTFCTLCLVYIKQFIILNTSSNSKIMTKINLNTHLNRIQSFEKQFCQNQFYYNLNQMMNDFCNLFKKVKDRINITWSIEFTLNIIYYLSFVWCFNFFTSEMPLDTFINYKANWPHIYSFFHLKNVV